MTSSIANETVDHSKNREPFSFYKFITNKYFLNVVSIVLFLALWDYVAKEKIFRDSLARPLEVVDQLYRLTYMKFAGTNLIGHIWASTQRVLIGFAIFTQVWTDKLWFDSIGFGTVFSIELITRLALFFGVGGLMALLVGGNMWLAIRLRPRGRRNGDSAVLELVGLNKPTANNSPTVATFLNGSMADATHATEVFRRIITAELPISEVAAQLRQPATRPVLLVESLNVDPSGNPIEWARAWFAGDRVKLTIDHHEH